MPKPKQQERDYTTVSIPISLTNRIEKYVEREDAIYKSKVDFTLSAVRKLLDEYGMLEPKPILEHFNLDEDGIRIVDHSLVTRNSPNGRIIDVYFKQEKVWCDHCKSQECRHVKFALEIPKVKEILKNKGWEISKNE